MYINKFEENYGRLISTKVSPREAFGGLWACYESNLASLEGIKYWEKVMEKHAGSFHSIWIKELLQAFNNNRKLRSSHMISIFDSLLKPRLLELWQEQVNFNQRTMYDLIKEFKTLKYYDEEIFTKIIDSLIHKNTIQNLYFFDRFYNFIHDVNENPKGTLYGKWTQKIKDFEEKHYSKDYKWRYNLEERRRRTHQELVDRRDEFDWEDFMTVQATDERSERERKRLENEQQKKYAVYNEELFIKIVKEMMDEGKTMIEMMVYLDVDEEALQNAFSLISKQDQIAKLEELRRENKLPIGNQKL